MNRRGFMGAAAGIGVGLGAAGLLGGGQLLIGDKSTAPDTDMVPIALPTWVLRSEGKTILIDTGAARSATPCSPSGARFEAQAEPFRCG
jgi:hypothetical protein